MGDEASSQRLGEMAEAARISRIHMVAWRDLDDPEAGGSELHAHEIARRWAAAGIEVTSRTSAIAGRASSTTRDGYSVERRSGRYGVFPSVIGAGLRQHVAKGDALVEIWNGMPFLSPIWWKGPRVTFLHHVHEEMWQMALPGTLGRVGDLIERRLAPPFYRRERVVTLSESSRREIIERLHLSEEQVTVAMPGIGSQYVPGHRRSSEPLVVAVGRLVPVKRFDLLIQEMAQARRLVPTLRLVIVGEGYERSHLESQIRALGAEDWIALPGFVSTSDLVDWYQRAWCVVSASLREGWGMTLTEAAACATPAVATAIAGHNDAIDDEKSGLLVDDVSKLGATTASVLLDDGLRQRLSDCALERSGMFSWDETARVALAALAGLDRSPS